MSILRLRWLYGVQGASLGLLLPFLVPLLDHRGLSPAGIGLVLGASGLVSLAAYAIWGALADGPLGRSPAIALAAVLAAVGGAFLVVAGSDPLILTLAVSVALVGALPWGPISDALALTTLGEGSSSYGRLRAWASLGWAATAVSGGVAWTFFGPTPVLAAYALLALGVAGSVLIGASGRGARPTSGPAPAPGTDRSDAPEAVGPVERGVPRLRTWARTLASPVLLAFLVGFFVASVGEHGVWRYVGLRILEQGGGAFMVGLAAALPALVEIPVFGGSRRWADRLGLRMLFVWGALLAAGLALLIGLAPEAWMVTLLRTVDGSSYALRYVAMVLIIGALLPRHLHALGQSLAWLVGMGVAPIISDSLGGLVYDQLGGTALFAAAAMTILVGAGIGYVALSGPAFRRGAEGPAAGEEPGAVGAPRSPVAASGEVRPGEGV